MIHAAGGTWRRAVLTFPQGLAVQLLEVLPVGKFKPPAPLRAAYVHYPSRGRYDSLASGRVRTTLESPHHSRPPCGQLRSSGQCSSALSHFIPPDSTVLTPRATLIHIPALNSIRVCIPESQPATRIRKYSSIWGGFLLKITGYTCIYNILKPPNKTQNGRSKDLLCEWFKLHNLMLSDQMKLSYMLITKENYMLNLMKQPLYHL